MNKTLKSINKSKDANITPEVFLCSLGYPVFEQYPVLTKKKCWLRKEKKRKKILLHRVWGLIFHIGDDTHNFRSLPADQLTL